MIDQPGKLYLGREFNLSTQQTAEEPLLISARDLTTHAVCLGMTGSGKTGLGIGVLEELLLQNIPLIIVDPKGDITNLALTFPNLQPQDFKPWLTEDEAAQNQITLDELSTRTAQKWREGLAGSGIAPERLQLLRDRSTVRIYTPGSDAGIPVNVLQGLSPPENIGWADNAELLRERIAQVCSAILELAGIEADPMKSREHILMATIFEAAWRAAQSMDMAMLIRMIQDPPVTKIGVFDMDTFYPKSERFELAMALNTLVASPSFASWQSGPPLDIPSLIKPSRDTAGINPAGRTPANVFYVAHLGDQERQFFVTLLLSQLVMWMRSQTGTSVLRCLVYFDEVFGYLPPTRNPPTKTPMMTIIKQGRAAGLGMFMATQNPADLDYKALGNIGTWFIGRLRTERDRDRSLEGLEGAGVGLDRAQLEGPLSTLPARTFLIQSASGTPKFLRTRWAMSFLRGPMTRDEIRNSRRQAEAVTGATQMPSQPVVAPVVAPVAAPVVAPVAAPAVAAQAFASQPAAVPPVLAQPTAPTAVSSTPAPAAPPATTVAAAAFAAAMKPSTPPDVREVYLPIESAPLGGSIIYRPHLLASANVRFADRASGAAATQRYSYLLPLAGLLTVPDYNQAQTVSSFDVNALTFAPQPNASFADLPQGLSVKWMKQAERGLVEHVYRNATATVWVNRALKVTSAPGEKEIDFRARCEAAAKPKRDAEAQKLRDQFERKLETLQDKLAKEQRELSQDRAEVDARKRDETMTNIESVFNLVIGRGRGGVRGAMSKGSTRRRMAETAEADARESEETIAQLNQDIQQVGEDYRVALQELSDKWAAVIAGAEEVAITPKKTDIFADVVTLAWVPTKS